MQSRFVPRKSKSSRNRRPRELIAPAEDVDDTPLSDAFLLDRLAHRSPRGSRSFSTQRYSFPRNEAAAYRIFLCGVDPLVASGFQGTRGTRRRSAR